MRGLAPLSRTPRELTVQRRTSNGNRRRGSDTQSSPVQLEAVPMVSASAVQTEASTTKTNEDKKKRREERVKFPFLRPERFQHPRDAQLMRQLKAAAPLEAAIRFGFSVVEPLFTLQMLSSAVKVSERQMPKIHSLLVEACEILDIGFVPELYVVQDPRPNAYTIAFQGKRPFIAVHSSLVELMDPAELQAVIAHELGHLKCEHSVYISTASLAAQIAEVVASRLGLPGAAQATEAVVRSASQAAEFSCDRAALLVTQDPDVVVSAFLKLLGGTRSPFFSDTLDVDEFLQQADEYEKIAASPMGRLFNLERIFATHPLPLQRGKEMKRWFDSREFQGLLRRGTPLKRREGGGWGKGTTGSRSGGDGMGAKEGREGQGQSVSVEQQRDRVRQAEAEEKENAVAASSSSSSDLL
uniref:Peptidase M48 domain-containing protein n=1 Tax=Chromera velia CCMP2878 TaxID=1169474 RepID=A0A0G4I7L5_9ALVE|eukprot:Cvel_11699.t1-p1 / transcript=Cvel_11699.t1 / gene=Cvel_11699 / organism=Chromera_velia_CCMP2878 / gene_product=Protease HtpX homolog 2, putative / transcript_product=Protease HtpX homolog 2, putative / location=Cvel_scaffold742:26506-31033(-) / protein_length=411 / sequence_SO=supercontig / SO=protein_coding / is_pseudo=false